jgi:hypothetical protein
MNRKLIRIFFGGVACSFVAPALAASEVGGACERAVAITAGDAASDTDPFVPDVYPSKAEATRAVIRRWKRESDDALIAMPCVEVSNDAPDAGTVEMAHAVPGAVLSARFVEKPWLCDFAGFVSKNPGGRWVVGRTDPRRPATSAAEAARAARTAAVEEVSQLVRSRLPERLRRRDGGRIRDAVEASLVDGGDLVVDRFPQKFDRGYGTLYREAVLIDASDAKLASVVKEVTGSIREHRQYRTRAFIGSGAVLLVILGIYRLANAFTRGYFTWSLRTTAALIAVVAVAMWVAVA